ncbi:hypothetical protein DWB77_04185 [Streptomyces hundungensis]|uniref:Uncharacterized protein n=1 Tax=Streptomyces hundungensis TaxID=1077946 RepID=A0A387HNR4_9ACTN|nr:hypothetical protein DWB77_04185 [Streptomyces hundungensis]
MGGAGMVRAGGLGVPGAAGPRGWGGLALRLGRVVWAWGRSRLLGPAGRGWWFGRGGRGWWFGPGGRAGWLAQRAWVGGLALGAGLVALPCGLGLAVWLWGPSWVVWPCGPCLRLAQFPAPPKPPVMCGSGSLLAQFLAPLKTRVRLRTVPASRAVPRAPGNPCSSADRARFSRSSPRPWKPAFVCGPCPLLAQFPAPLETRVRLRVAGGWSRSSPRPELLGAGPRRPPQPVMGVPPGP